MDLSERSNNNCRHPWELSRTRCIISVLKKYGIKGTVLDIGCGDSYFDERLLEAFPDIEVYGVDIELTEEELRDGERLHTTNSLELLPDIKFDFILMMDVLEHIADDTGYLTGIKERLSDEGTILITVPAFQSLYSLHDKELRHFRRYNHSALKKVILGSGLKEKYCTYFYFSLIIGRLLTKNKTENLSSWKASENSLKTKLVTFVLNADYSVLNFFSRLRVHIPGLSLLSICKKE